MVIPVLVHRGGEFSFGSTNGLLGAQQVACSVAGLWDAVCSYRVDFIERMAATKVEPYSKTGIR